VNAVAAPRRRLGVASGMRRASAGSSASSRDSVGTPARRRGACAP